MKALTSSTVLAIRFSETDAMGVVWHGNYLKYFEDIRDKITEEYGLSHLDIYHKGFFTPVVKTEINYKASIFYGQKIKVTTWLEQHLAAKIIFRYEVFNLTTNQISATGMTMQVFMNAETRELEIIKPNFYQDWEKKQKWIKKS